MATSGFRHIPCGAPVNASEGHAIEKVKSKLQGLQDPWVLLSNISHSSHDSSAAEIEATGAYLVNHPINMGQGAALQTGIEFARRLPGIRYLVMDVNKELSDEVHSRIAALPMSIRTRILN